MTNTSEALQSNQLIYLRIGDWHPSETSLNYAAGETETGVSAYDLIPDGSIVVPPESEWAREDLLDRLASGEPRYLVQGSWVGCGGDGEPLLRDIKVVGIWPQDLPDRFTASIDDLDDALELLSAEEAMTAAGLAATATSP